MTIEFDFLLLISVIFFFSSLIHGSIGFGFPMMATPLLALVTDLKTAIIYVIIPNILVNIISIASEGDFLRSLKRFMPLAILTTIGSAIGTLVLIYSSSELFKLLLAFFILFYLFTDKLNINFSWVATNPKRSFYGFGLFSGVVGGLTNAMGPVLIIYTLEMKYSKKEIIQASNICFMLGKITQLILFASYGDFGVTEIEASVFSLLFVGLAMYVGIKVKKKISKERFTKVIKVFLALVASVLVGQVLI